MSEADKPPTPEPPPNTTLAEQLVLLLVSGIPAETAERYCVQQGQTPANAKALVIDARNKITVAADFNREEQIGLQITRLEALYKSANGAKDFRTALQSIREKSRLLRLYNEPDSGINADLDAQESQTIRRQLKLITDYIRPLALVSDKYPIEEHVRVASEIVRISKGVGCQAKNTNARKPRRKRAPLA